MLDFFINDLKNTDQAVADLIGYEAERQSRKLILIPSESQAPEAIREALGSVFQNIYAEGYPDPRLYGLTESEILDYEEQLSWYRRYADRRYYRGVEYVNVLETLAQRRAAEVFATNSVDANQIRVNVQPLSGSPANSAVYSALVPPGSTVMGMDLLHGGHLTHGSPVNRSGKLHNIISYGIDPKTERLDYSAIEELALKHSPKLIIAGFTSYPWIPDWARFRQIADMVGAYLLADISHIAGMVAAGVAASPVGHAHVISFTTHKTLYGPRGAAILSFDKAIARKIDSAVFPGEQGGPHVNTIAGMAVAFKLAKSDSFRQLQQQVVNNAQHLASELQRHGFRIPYGGTDSHMLLLDTKGIRAEKGISPDKKKGTPLMGDTAARILDLSGIVLNRNTIPGDRTARYPSGIRMGTPWITQRGFGKPEIETLAEIIARVLRAIEPYATMGRRGPIFRGKVDFQVLEDAKWDVVGLACCADLDPDYSPSGYPHHFFMHKPTKDPGGDFDIIEIEGEHARGFCNVAMTNDVYLLSAGESQPTWILDPDGQPITAGVLRRLGDETTLFQLLIPKAVEAQCAHWLRALSNGYVHLDPDDVFAKTPGPVVVRRLPHELADQWDMRPPELDAFEREESGWAFHKTYWIGQRARSQAPGDLESLQPFEWQPEATDELKKTALNQVHHKMKAKMVPFAGWELPVRYDSVHDEHVAVRERAGLFDVSHMGLFEFTGENVHLFLNTLTTNDVSLLQPGGSQYSFLLDPEGEVIDDIWLYRLEAERYWMVVNAANKDKDLAWLNAVKEAHVVIDSERPWSRALGLEKVQIIDLTREEGGDDKRSQLALQGPCSLDILLELAEGDEVSQEILRSMKRTEIASIDFPGFHLYVSRTGYTGEPMAYELFAHPALLPALWYKLIEAGSKHGMVVVGLAARDSLRIEAGLPLYGHELAGPLALNPADAGFSPYVKLYKPFFIGKNAFMKHEDRRKSRLVRFQLVEEHARRPDQGDIVVNRKGRVVGAITSCSVGTDGGLVGLAYVQETHSAIGSRLVVFQLGRSWSDRPLQELKTGDRVQLHDEIRVLRRFLNKKK